MFNQKAHRTVNGVKQEVEMHTWDGPDDPDNRTSTFTTFLLVTKPIQLQLVFPAQMDPQRDHMLNINFDWSFCGLWLGA
jgi:hypothetical protein